MPVTSAQIDSTLRIKKEFNLITGAGTLTDLSNWSGIGVISPNTAKVLLWIVTPTGATLYKNAGYDTDVYTSPDFTLLDSSYSFTIPQDVNSEYITGTYVFYAKAQVTDGVGYNSLSTTINPAGVGVPQFTQTFVVADGSYASLAAIPNDIFSVSYSGEYIQYVIQSGDTYNDAVDGLAQAILDYQTANPTSDWALNLTVSAQTVGLFRSLETNGNSPSMDNVPYTLTFNWTNNALQTVTSNQVSSTAEVCNCTATIAIDIDVDYATAVLTSTDTTAYGAYSSITRTHTIYPPPISGLPDQTTNATTNVYSNIVTTTWSVEISSDVTYLKANDTYTTCRLVGSKEVLVEADTLCNTLCLIKKFRTDFYSKYGKKCVDDMEKAYNLAMDEFYLAFMATRCGRPQSEIQGYINKIYEITGLDPNCDCGCNAGDYPTPVVPTSIINGSDGTDGVTPEFQNTGTWIQVSYDEGSTWNNLFSLASVTGAAGANGTNGTDGADGVAVLHNDLADDTTSNAGVETLKTYQLAAGQLASNGDMIEIRVRFTVPNKNTGTVRGDCYVLLGATQLTLGQILNNIYGGYHVIRISRTGATAGKSDYEIQTRSQIGIQGAYVGLNSVAPTWANANDIYVKADDNGGELITCDLFQVTYYKA